jgi:hypothetical protein
MYLLNGTLEEAFRAMHRAFMHLELKRSGGLIASRYEFKRHFADQAITNFIQQAVMHPHGA